mmetsp:Transcript_17970/g.21520  ORF Transcript_17970/g.21520 Transcript_17970/m.21520 type:complete len:757 (-) Transcript_17970:215-2485(-)|eukprot:CAMPEP_0197846104 /NCGR_PEP_ID=MMETSP1438-20131217/2913_1 /TAXON_ID=1461541 /ORGANISM="Pterosperma sp., Strain CCMP1384" /LENGTH=756 /DNA_ID=CAMNT_0043457633 /DNA_START=184 /DNA_END=2454 /DNA_ORIENTATION=-
MSGSRVISIGGSKASENALVLADLAPSLREKLAPLDKDGNGIILVNEIIIPSSDSISLSAFPKHLQKDMRVFDGSGDGNIDYHELQEASRLYKASKEKSQSLLKMVVALSIFVGVLLAANLTMTFVIVDMAKDTENTKGAATDRDTGATVRTAKGLVVASNVQDEISRDMSGPDDDLPTGFVGNPGGDTITLEEIEAAEGPSSQRHLLMELLELSEEDKKAVAGIVAKSTAEEGCKFMCDGNIMVPVDYEYADDQPPLTLEVTPSQIYSGCICSDGAVTEVSHPMTAEVLINYPNDPDKSMFYMDCPKEGKNCVLIDMNQVVRNKKRMLLMDLHQNDVDRARHLLTTRKLAEIPGKRMCDDRNAMELEGGSCDCHFTRVVQPMGLGLFGRKRSLLEESESVVSTPRVVSQDRFFKDVTELADLKSFVADLEARAEYAAADEIFPATRTSRALLSVDEADDWINKIVDKELAEAFGPTTYERFAEKAVAYGFGRSAGFQSHMEMVGRHLQSVQQRKLLNTECTDASFVYGSWECDCYWSSDDPNCFPADSTVEVLSPISGEVAVRHVADLQLGDKVKAVNTAGRVVWDEVYLLAHSDEDSMMQYVKLTTESGQSLHISEGHYLPVRQRGDTFAKNTAARDTIVGDAVYVLKDGSQVFENVVEVVLERKQGAFHPMTLDTGRIVVDGVVATVYAECIWEALFGRLFSAEQYVAMSHIFLAPLRMIRPFVSVDTLQKTIPMKDVIRHAVALLLDAIGSK